MKLADIRFRLERERNRTREKERGQEGMKNKRERTERHDTNREIKNTFIIISFHWLKYTTIIFKRHFTEIY